MGVRDLFDLRGRIALVTGGAGHLGTAISEALCEAGARVYIAGRHAGTTADTARRLGDTSGTEVRSVSLDICDSDSVTRAFQLVRQEAGTLDILVNNAANLASGPDAAGECGFIAGIDGTINGVFRCTQAATSIMDPDRGGSVINIASMYGIVSPDPSVYGNSGQNNPPSYGAGKAAILQFTRYCACHLAGRKIRVNAISPGPFPKPAVRERDPGFVERLARKVPMGRVGEPEELKGAVVFLASIASSYVTGANLVIDGGWTAW